MTEVPLSFILQHNYIFIFDSTQIYIRHLMGSGNSILLAKTQARLSAHSVPLARLSNGMQGIIP
ncbi:uncharacterized protein PgNI_00953 [Pyricularia grisea]|uniref:Uncharacterized protein n=1 Tax=Pyricularia grisea TaxID=148305 RepID=A0A6P8BL97_PYRGI|nr:uncharacterized protein PgNI_00953 [Pyricularia grisea]TLD17636.1 hypothetical protein PgNI_00953 [Pyricularia grisea]